MAVPLSAGGNNPACTFSLSRIFQNVGGALQGQGPAFVQLLLTSAEACAIECSPGPCLVVEYNKNSHDGDDQNEPSDAAMSIVPPEEQLNAYTILEGVAPYNAADTYRR